MSRLVWLPFDPADLGEPPSGLTVRAYDPRDPGPREDVTFLVPDYDTGLDVSMLVSEMRSLAVVQTQTAGVDNLLAHVPESVTLCNARGVHDASTAELAVGLLLSSLRGLDEFARAMPQGRWLHGVRPALADRRVLILGYGSIGEALERRLLPFEVEVVRVARSAREGVHPMADLPALLADVDAVVVLVPLSESTRSLVDADFLAAMRPGAVLVNVARGPVVDTAALLDACRRGHVRAALDVTDPEPLPADHPLWRTPGVLVSPHVGGATSAMRPRVLRLLREQLRRYAAGEPLLNVMPR